MLNVTIPVHNEEAQLSSSIEKLTDFLDREMEVTWEIVIADNGSTDRTLEIARQLANKHIGVRVSHVDLKGRGASLRSAWMESRADILTYMDVDLSTDLSAFPTLVQGLICGGYDLAVGSRLHPGSTVVRGFKRELISRGYNFLLKTTCSASFADAQCGFKAIRKPVLLALLPQVKDGGWFFDTELLIAAQNCGCRILEVPVKWTEDLDTRVKILPAAWENIKGILRIRRSIAKGDYHSRHCQA